MSISCCKYITKNGNHQILLHSFILLFISPYKSGNMFHICGYLSGAEKMIQRIQSVYLLIVVILSVLLFFLPISTKIIPVDLSKNISKDISYKMNLYGTEKFENGSLTSSDSNLVLLILNLAAGITSLVIILLYRKRIMQMKLTRLAILFTSAFIVVDFYFSDALGKEYGEAYKPMYLSGSYFPVIQLILLVMAMRAIKKDEDLVRSADRIR